MGQPGPAQLQHHSAATGTAQQFGEAGRAQVRARHALAAEAQNLVAGLHAGLLGRPATERGHNGRGIAKQVELDAHAVEVALQEGVGFFAVAGRDVNGVRVELFQHLHHGVIGQGFGIDGIGVVAVYVAQNLLEA